jgi:predicted permease
VLQDLRYGTRVLLRAPGFTLVAALTLALGIGANASIFSLVNGLVLKPPAGIQAPDRLVQVARSYESAPRWDNFSWPALQLIRTEARALSGVAGHSDQVFVMGRGSETEQLLGQLVTGDYFDVLGVRPWVGRLLLPADDVEPGAHAVVVLSHGLWLRRFGGDPEVVGRTVPLGAVPYEVVGVAPPGFAGARSLGAPPALWVPTMQRAGYGGELPFDQWGSSWIYLVGRLAEGVSFEQAQASMGVVSRRLREASTTNADMLALLERGVGLDPGDRRQAEQISLVLVLIVGLVLLLACTNVANLSLARAAARRAEVGVRVALGAARSRVARQLAVESTLLAALATLLAVPIVLAAGDFLPRVFPYAVSVSFAADARVFVFLVLVGGVAGLLFGIAPAWTLTRRGAIDALRGGASTAGRSRTRLRDALVVSQLGLSLGLVAAAALLGRSVLNASSADAGFQPRGLTAAFVDLEPTGRYDAEGGRRLFSELARAAEALPGVRAATIASQTPIAGGHSRSTVRPEGRTDVDFEAERTVVGARYFEAMGIDVVRGRTLGGLDEEPEPVVVVNRALARMFWPGEDAVGKRLAGDPGWRVVGVAEDVQMRSLRSAANPGVYYPLAHLYSPRMVVHVASEAGRPLGATALREMVASLDPELPVGAVVDLHEAMSASMAETRTVGLLVGAFALLALTLAVVGLYGLVSYGAAQRVREIGIRIALGAEPGSLVRLVVARGVAISILGVVVGLGVAFALGRALQSLLFEVEPTDAATLAGAALLLVSTAVLGAWLPARRAGRVDPTRSLREF